MKKNPWNQRRWVVSLQKKSQTISRILNVNGTRSSKKLQQWKLSPTSEAATTRRAKIQPKIQPEVQTSFVKRKQEKQEPSTATGSKTKPTLIEEPSFNNKQEQEDTSVRKKHQTSKKRKFRRIQIQWQKKKKEQQLQQETLGVEEEYSTHRLHIMTMMHHYYCLKTFGFAADPDKPLWQNIEMMLSDMPV